MDIEKEIQAKGLNAPRITPAAIEACIVSEYSFTAAQAANGCPQHEAMALLTFCVLVLRNGFTVTGQSACASPENFDSEIGRKVARADAVRQIWPLEGYLLRERLHRASAQPVPGDLPLYTCHKAVRAGRIAGISPEEGGATIDLVDEGPTDVLRFFSVDVDGAWLNKHNPQVGGYYVVYADGYTSYSPAEAFESGYTRLGA